MTPSKTADRRRVSLRHDERGQVTAFTVVIVVALLLVSGLVWDGGHALAAKVRAIGEAQEAARAGAQEIDLTAFRAGGALRLMPQQATTAAETYLASTGYNGAVSVTGNTVNVTVTISQPTSLLGLIGIDSLTVSGSAQAQPQEGIAANP